MMRRVRLSTAAHALAGALRRSGQRIVFAESCTAGLCAATLGRIAGISQHLCGSLVVYRNATKAAYLDLDPAWIEHVDPVSAATAIAMAERALSRTPEADLALSATGHLGPGAPVDLDGHVYIGRQSRGQPATSQLLRHPPHTSRVERQRATVAAVFQQALGLLG